MFLSLQDSYQRGCDYVTSPLNPTLNKGCAKYCNATKKVRVQTLKAKQSEHSGAFNI